MDTERFKGHAAGRRPLPSAVSAMHTESSCVGEETAASLGAQGILIPHFLQSVCSVTLPHFRGPKIM